MDSFGGNKETGRDEKISKSSVGRGHRVWLHKDSGGLRRPHSASSANQSFGSDSSTTTMTQYSQEDKKFELSPQAAEFVPKFLQSHASQSSLTQSPTVEPNVPLSSVLQPVPPYPKSSVQDRIRLARETPSVFPPVLDDSTFEDTLEQQCNIQDLNIGDYNNYRHDQDDVNSSKSEKQQNEKEDVYNFETYEHLNNIINILIMNPAEFTNLVPPFMDKLRSSGNVRCLQLVVIPTIIEWSIAESNFRYNGARLCKYFDTSLEESKELYMFSKKLFRDLLYFQCKLETGLLESEWLNQPEEKRDQRKCNGLILFLAELVAQMDESYAFTLGELLVWFITTVLQRPASSSVKYICQALKLAGHVLEKDKRGNKDMENMMRMLTELVNKGQVDMHVGNMVNSVHELRKDWGRDSTFNCNSSGSSNALHNEVQRQPDQLGASNYNSSEIDTAPSKTQHPIPQRIQLNQPVMYGPDGEILSAEESEFLEAHAKADLDEGTSEEEPDDNYDDEIATAYEEFLRDAKCK